MTQTADPQSSADNRGSRGLLARVSLGRSLRPMGVETVLILASTLALTVFGVVMNFSATTVDSIQATGNPWDQGMSHMLFAGVALVAMVVLSRFSNRWLQRLAWPAMILGIALQLLVFTPLGYESGGNRNWVRIGGFSMQPAEFLKAALAIWLGVVIYRKRDRLHRFWELVIPIFPVALLALATVMAGEDLGTVMIMAFLVMGALFFGGVRMRFLLPIIGAGIAAVFALAIVSPNRMDRIMSALDPNCLEDYQNLCYQPLHGIWALAGGGFLGAGLGNSKEKYSWLPAAADDYIFAIVGEELGLLGCAVVLLLFGILTVGIFGVIRRTDDVFVRTTAGAIGVWIIGQALVNIGVVLRLLPALGVPLPFLSSGGSSLVAVLLACGVLLALARTLPERAVPSSADRASARNKIVR
ncbi:peptidoglycan glycosyltransferase FtsW [Microbacterium amylolyticum]|uniref:Probable peptidoglycan glycosyltransferase FtsW n=1 Tax=Microbacterium amylolyticum TaxID=936337 RepID=A0ABS4ZFE7_9MICO|nr:putative peptidoglycan glycosyltransferase FtsW [Microbacterium amylolyticum]MBP2435994.1 cell division protein FtsW [Microbacterium amylolyticum]